MKKIRRLKGEKIEHKRKNEKEQNLLNKRQISPLNGIKSQALIQRYKKKDLVNYRAF